MTSPSSSSASSTELLPWVEKYRPTALGDILAQQDIVQTIERFAERDQLPHMLFYGPPGTGKTTTVLALARRLFGPSHLRAMVLELNASDERGIDVVRQQIKDFVSTRRIFSSGVKIVILDEADAMTKAAQMALRRVIEKYTRNARFCIICNYVSQIIPAVQSRCTRFRFAPLAPELILPRLRDVAAQEGVPTDDAGLRAVMRLSGGDMRKCLNTMQAASLAHGAITVDSVYSCTGNPHPEVIDALMLALRSQSYCDAAAAIARVQVDHGVSLVDIVREIHGRVLATPDIAQSEKAYMLHRLASLDENLQTGCHDSLQLGALVAAFRPN